MSGYRLILILVLFLSFLGCGKDESKQSSSNEKNLWRDWEKPGKPVQPAPKPGRVLVK